MKKAPVRQNKNKIEGKPNEKALQNSSKSKIEKKEQPQIKKNPASPPLKSQNHLINCFRKPLEVCDLVNEQKENLSEFYIGKMLLLIKILHLNSF